MASTISRFGSEHHLDRFTAMTPEDRRRSYEKGELTRAELYMWAAHFPEEVPLIDGELPWIVATLADLD